MGIKNKYTYPDDPVPVTDDHYNAPQRESVLRLSLPFKLRATVEDEYGSIRTGSVTELVVPLSAFGDVKLPEVELTADGLTDIQHEGLRMELENMALERWVSAQFKAQLIK